MFRKVGLAPKGKRPPAAKNAYVLKPKAAITIVTQTSSGAGCDRSFKRVCNKAKFPILAYQQQEWR